mmetsp:Transcript_45356/g.147466  ORF Transcript_45356/g.147466 Transcript_45356/m.147466 type:complete len:220 (+) Transcript_45356:131-790(+)
MGAAIRLEQVFGCYRCFCVYVHCAQPALRTAAASPAPCPSRLSHGLSVVHLGIPDTVYKDGPNGTPPARHTAARRRKFMRSTNSSKSMEPLPSASARAIICSMAWSSVLVLMARIAERSSSRSMSPLWSASMTSKAARSSSSLYDREGRRVLPSTDWIHALSISDRLIHDVSIDNRSSAAARTRPSRAISGRASCAVRTAATQLSSSPSGSRAAASSRV